MVMKDNERNKVYVPKEPSESEIFSQGDQAPHINVIDNNADSIDPSEGDDIDDVFRSPENRDEEERKSGMINSMDIEQQEVLERM